MNGAEQKYTLFIHGMHCKSCVFMTESELKDHPRVSDAKSSLETRSVEIYGRFEGMSLDEIANELSTSLHKHGYSLSTEQEKKAADWSEFMIAIPVALGFAVLFVALQKLGIVNLVNTSQVTYGTSFVIGMIASLSTCLAVVGGLVLSMSATFAKEGDRTRPQLYFHVARLISFFVLGGVIGLVGSAFQIGGTGTFVLGMIIGLVMLVLGLNLLEVFHFTKRLQPAMPKFLADKALRISRLNHALTPTLVGAATFFLPCGFTQSMQIYTLSTGNFITGGLTMLSFAIGTLPVLALVSFSSFSIKDNAKKGIFFKSAGLIVILFAIFNIINSLVAAGWIKPIFNF
ncbi:MAG: hypothetical protein A3I29_02895 [Candidatus Magasanikbacteria bacterium RIFCSPLOWO2_02_FULL_44_11]|uniref:HMA domain-containing protein n=1 Tax=Candidatus Magasanikbacteria bacterium RIFCSPLOWO2_02_FULL_44_11 TaxID=1798689 RepID=A0A1F6NB29_9BACT|nr:MAG: hypothetical protein A3I29_02895 [Candidatus Magasanikbacteria bacterium RIFCSPLOWO2_02_FULL_44_11]